jgi:hypothetical protein
VGERKKERNKRERKENVAWGNLKRRRNAKISPPPIM